MTRAARDSPLRRADLALEQAMKRNRAFGEGSGRLSARTAGAVVALTIPVSTDTVRNLRRFKFIGLRSIIGPDR